MAELAKQSPSKAILGTMQNDAVTFQPNCQYRCETNKGPFETERYCLSLNGVITLHLKRQYVNQLLGSTPPYLRQIRQWYFYCAHLNSLYLLLDSFVVQDSSIGFFRLEEVTSQNAGVGGVGRRLSSQFNSSIDRDIVIPDDLVAFVNNAFETATDDFERIYVFSELAKSLAACNSGDFATSFVLAWFILERFIERFWKQYLDKENVDLAQGRRRINAERRNALNDTRSYTAAVKSQVLELGGSITLEQLTELNWLRQKRNEIVHPPRSKDEQVVFQGDIDSCRRSFSMLEQFVLREFQIPLLFDPTFSWPGVFDRQ